MATEGGEERKADMVLVPVVTRASRFIGSWIINPLPINDKPGMKALVAWFTFFHGPVSGAVVLAISFVVQGKIDAYLHICQMASLSIFVESFAAILMLLLLFSGWWSWVLSFIALLMIIVTVRLSVRLLIYVPLSGSYSCFDGDVIKAAAAVAAVILGELALSFWGAMVFVRYLYGTNDHSQSQRGSSSVQCASSEG